ncbi:hypothetical protein J2S00_003554 [Caldalkalibacillus uzonensis]|uniref:Uncharacterized protein n=2 Tax=Caldalkalibacillus uzonensis TaxID=353224 RepID=A0ABU0CX42_9BACI|nr:hypothetical protein [Caldalkalibacillus uzonensis]
MGTRFLLGPLSKTGNEHPRFEQLVQWYRHNVEVRDVRGAERVLLTAIESGATTEALNEMMMTAITDHFYMNTGHTLDFHNKAFEILEHIGDEHRPYVLTSLLPELANAPRSEELHSWQAPVDLVQPLHEVFEKLPDLLHRQPSPAQLSVGNETIVQQLLSDNPLETDNLLLQVLKEGMTPVRLAQIVTLAAAERIARFHVQNDMWDWITVLHTFTHAHAVHEALKRSASPELTRSIFHTAMSIYLDRFLNIPAARRPNGDPHAVDPNQPEALLALLNQQQQTDQAGKWVMNYLAAGGDKAALFNTLGHALLREDAEFHSFQMYEAAVKEYEEWAKEKTAFAHYTQETLILAVTRYLAAHAPTHRETTHTAHIAMRLQRGDNLFKDDSAV